jgi:hypothetical protein
MGDRALELRYEDLVERPAEVVAALARFCGVPEAGDTAVPRIDASRAFAYRRDPALVEFAGSVHGTLARHGYAP